MAGAPVEPQGGFTVQVHLISPDAHTLDHDEVFMVTEGSLCVQLDAEPLHAGDVAVVPAGTPIQISNPGAVPATAYIAIGAGFAAAMVDGTVIGTPPWAR